LGWNQKYFLMGIRKGNISHLLFRLSMVVALVGSNLNVVTKLTGQLKELGLQQAEPVLSPRTSLEPGLWLGAIHHTIPYDVHMDSRAPGLTAFRNI
ncbi:mCG1026222, partial [Mus musculus]